MDFRLFLTFETIPIRSRTGEENLIWTLRCLNPFPFGDSQKRTRLNRLNWLERSPTSVQRACVRDFDLFFVGRKLNCSHWRWGRQLQSEKKYKVIEFVAKEMEWLGKDFFTTSPSSMWKKQTKIETLWSTLTGCVASTDSASGGSSTSRDSLKQVENPIFRKLNVTSVLVCRLCAFVGKSMSISNYWMLEV